MSQSRKMSAIEQICNVGSGWFLSFLLWSFVVAPIWGMKVTTTDNLGITAIFTIVSVIRGYIWRRAFNAIKK